MALARFSRRDLLKLSAAGAAVGSLSACATNGTKPSLGRVVVVGGGFGGATAAKYLRIFSEGRIEVTLVEPNASFISCPMSNLVIGGSKKIADITVAYSGLEKYGVRLVRDTVAAIDPDKREARLSGGQTLPYDRLVLSPGIEFLFENVRGMSAAAAEQIPHGWKAGPQTLLLRSQLEAMADGGVVVMSVPLAPYRCPPGPYERACQIAHYIRTAKPKSKLIVLDANPEMVSKRPLFTAVFQNDYKGIIDYRNGAAVGEVDVKGKAFVLDLGEKVGGDVLNLIPPQRAANIARDAGVITANNRWCEVDWTTMESVKVKNIHVLGDATQSAPLMPKSGHMANQHGKTAAAAIVELLSGRTPVPPMMANTCYSYIDATQAVHVSSVHRWVPEKKTLETVPGSGGVSAADRKRPSGPTCWPDPLGQAAGRVSARRLPERCFFPVSAAVVPGPSACSSAPRPGLDGATTFQDPCSGGALLQPKPAYRASQVVGMRFQRSRRLCALLDQYRILLRHLIELRESLVDFNDAGGLLRCGLGDAAEQTRNPLHQFHHIGHGGADAGDLLRAGAHPSRAVADQRLDLAGCLGAALSQRAHFGGHDREAAAVFARPGRLHRRVQRQHVGLERDAVDHADDLANAARARLNAAHCGHDLADRGPAAFGSGTRAAGQVVGPLRRIRALAHRARHLVDRGGSLLQPRALLIGARRQVLVGRGDLVRGRGDRV
jgi:NADPH-dependent 2,4-dienoyl-CoA reductase/sulfur reductase-like enzyme